MINISEPTVLSTSKDHTVVGNKKTQNIDEILDLNPNQSQYERGLQDQQDKFEKVNWLIYTEKKVLRFYVAVLSFQYPL